MIIINANELKEYIIANKCIITILQSLECHSIKEYSSEYRCALPDQNNSTAICIKKDNLSTAIRTRECEKKGDIFILIMTIKNFTFGKANRYIHEVLNLKYEFKSKKPTEEKEDPLFIFKKVKRCKCIVNKDMPTFDENIISGYSELPHIDWIRDGIMPFAMKRFRIGYSFDKKRITIPWSTWDDEDKILGIVGRTTIKNYEILDIPKYFGIKPFTKGNTLYGLAQNYESILNKGYVNVFEAEKSVLKRYSRKDNTSTAVGCHSFTDEQVAILISLNVDIVICFDEGIDINDIRKECDKFYGIRNVYYIFDKHKLMQPDMSPADLPNKQFEFLWKYKIKYDEKERKCFKDWQEKQKKN